MKKLRTIDFHKKLDEAYAECERAVAEAERIRDFKVGLTTIQHCGPNWLETGKVGGWNDEDDEWPEGMFEPVRKLSTHITVSRQDIEDARYLEAIFAEGRNRSRI